MKTRTWQTVLLIFAGIVIGAFVTEITKPISALSFLAFGLNNFGIPEPATLNLGILSVTLGFSVNITISTIIFVIATVYFGRRIFK